MTKWNKSIYKFHNFINLLLIVKGKWIFFLCKGNFNNSVWKGFSIQTFHCYFDFRKEIEEHACDKCVEGFLKNQCEIMIGWIILNFFLPILDNEKVWIYLKRHIEQSFKTMHVQTHHPSQIYTNVLMVINKGTVYDQKLQGVFVYWTLVLCKWFTFFWPI